MNILLMLARILQNKNHEIKNKNVTMYIKVTNLNSMFVFESTPNEIINIVNLLKSSNSVDYDEISLNLTKM